MLMELIKSVARRSKVSDIVYLVLNVAVAAAVLGLTVAFQPPIVAYALVILSKWRVFAVRPRFWWANLQTNMVDLMVGVSVVTLIWQASGTFLAQLLLALLYVVWLLMIKPRSSRSYMMIQAGISQFLALTALFSAAHLIDVSFVVALSFAVAYVVARHVLTAYEDDDATLLSIVWGFFMAELSWLSYHWMRGYIIVENVQVPQAAIIAGVAAFVVVRFYHASNHGTKLRTQLQAPILFALAILAILLLTELSGIIDYSN